MVYKYECNAMRKGSSVCHIPVSSSQPTQRAVSVCVCRGAQLFFYLGAKERERKVSRLLTWPLIAGTNNRYQFGVKFHFFKKKKEHLYKVIILFINISLIRKS